MFTIQVTGTGQYPGVLSATTHTVAVTAANPGEEPVARNGSKSG